ncbi:chitobiase/beta-hexosaminidase C-terminal domain-containing protein [Geomonas ferrireducens]|uniref:chitobiase/beta-hexosaminidase C-terminal domain-containing protein n=1 Tax=Geomonas ferrireducens TaxID=2570227 RepID=UPI001FEC3FCF|nr:chitobiase/beta-hexosaminidase C-terminal domain-containing protein [Geomonas ferrireducens]
MMRKMFAVLTCLAMVLALSVPIALAGRPVADKTAPTTTASPLGGTFTSAVTVTLSVNEAATTYYTTDGSTPTTGSTVYGAPLTFSATTTLKYFSKDTAGNLETVKAQTYTISGGGTSTHATLTWSGYSMCSTCHTSQAQAMYQGVHYQWKGSAAEMTTGPTSQGKMDATDGSSALNAYCINIQGNWGPCAACHAGTGAKPVATNNPSAAQLASIDCLICHADATNAPYSRVRNATTGLFEPAAGLNMNLVVQKAGQKPTRKNCLGCHAKAGGGDAVKRGDIALASGTTSDVLYDTHMAMGNGGNIQCQGCHTFTGHRVAGRGSDLRPEDSTLEVTCSTSACHPTKTTATGHVTAAVNDHISRIACQTCHINKYGKNANDTAATEATETNRNWQVAEWNATLNRYEPMPTKANDLIPRYAFWNGTSWGNNALNAAVLDAATGAYKISRPVGAITDPVGTKLYPFKYKTANQALANGKVVTISTATFFATGNYDQAVKDGMVYMGLPSTTAYSTVTTDELQVLNHQVPPATGNVLACAACHPNASATQLKLITNMGYALKAAQSVVCVQCHTLKAYSGDYVSFHGRHVDTRGNDCSWCHSFSRPEKGLKMP